MAVTRLDNFIWQPPLTSARAQFDNSVNPTPTVQADANSNQRPLAMDNTQILGLLLQAILIPLLQNLGFSPDNNGNGAIPQGDTGGSQGGGGAANVGNAGNAGNTAINPPSPQNVNYNSMMDPYGMGAPGAYGMVNAPYAPQGVANTTYGNSQINIGNLAEGGPGTSGADLQTANDLYSLGYNHPMGRALIDEAVGQNGTRIVVTNDLASPTSRGQYDPNNNEIRIRPYSSGMFPNEKEYMKTLFHELVHAATPDIGDEYGNEYTLEESYALTGGDDLSNSSHEEGRADQIGYIIATESLEGRQFTPEEQQQAYSNKVAQYPDLADSNNVDHELAEIGLA